VFLELHILQNFAPSNLNRDDTGAPKDCELGGHRRARISSQCLKRAIRTEFRDRELLPSSNLAVRTKRLRDRLVSILTAAGKPEAEAAVAAEAALASVGIAIADDGKSQYLIYLGEDQIGGIADACLLAWDDLAALAPANAAEPQRGGRQTKKAARQGAPEAVTRAVRAALDGSKAADLALFGRMLADLPDRNTDAAAQVAHAISTNRVSMEMDFYTAVDDLKPDDTAGADMLGTVEFNSACFYRYSNVDLAQLSRNLGGDTELCRATVRAFLTAAVNAVPTGKQNSMAAHNPPSLVLAILRDAGLWNLANAFVRPVRPHGEHDLVAASALALDGYFGRLAAMYGQDDLRGRWLCTTEALDFGGLTPKDVPTAARVVGIRALIDGVVGAATFDAPARRAS
jgi:CRISPR system Cascade subunit CasC